MDKRPDEITVDLYCDGAVLQSVKLNARNHWKHTFEDLERTHTWMVKEQKVPSGYKVTYDTSNGAQIITDTYVKQVPGQQTIPQTGLMWWPVPAVRPGRPSPRDGVSRSSPRPFWAAASPC